jgi:hypothetical protein
MKEAHLSRLMGFVPQPILCTFLQQMLGIRFLLFRLLGYF